MRVTKLFRYPVKSMQGEPLEVASVGPLGIAGDRQFGIVDVVTGKVLTGRREPSLLLASGRLLASTDEKSAVEVVLPDGRVAAGDADLSDWLGRPVRLEPAASHGVGTYEINAGEEREDGEWVAWQGPEGVFHDSVQTRISVIAEGDMRDWDVRRFRPNLVVDGDTVAHLVGRCLAVGDVRIDVRQQIDRCVMVTRPQPGGIERDLSILRTINREHATFLGAGAMVVSSGSIRIGDELTVLD